MEDGGREEWQIKEYSSPHEEGNETKVMWILDKGMNIGKKIVITGVVISSASFILPPIFVISAIGLALSVPSGILISSYLCTQKLMSMFLPIKTETECIDFEERGEGHEENIGDHLDKDTEDENIENRSVEERELPIEKTKAEEIKGSETERKDDDVATEEARSADTKGITAGNNDEKDIAIDIVAEETKAEEIKEGGKEKKRDDVARDESQSVDTKDEKDIAIDVVAEKTKAEEIKQSENEKKDDDVAKEVAQAGTTAGKNDEKDIAIDVGTEKTIVNGGETNKKSAKKKKGNKKNKASAAHEESEKKKEEEKVAPQTNVEGKDTSELGGSEKVPEPKQTAATTTTGKEEVGLSEEKIWEKFDALRAIVGYKASPERTYVWELRALYMFTGVDLPTSFKDSSDLVEVNDKLEILMSILGVK